MKRGLQWLWFGEFVGTTGLAVLLSVPGVPWYWVGIPVALLVTLKAVEYRLDVRSRYETVRHLLDLLDSLLPAAKGDARCTYHVPVRRILRKPKYMRQAFDYVPKGGGGGRRFSIEKGIIGKAFTMGGPRVENFATGQEYRERMQLEYGYTEREMGERTPDRRSYLAYPVVEGGTENVLGVLYFDSNVCQAFRKDGADDTWRMVEAVVQPVKRALS